MRDELPTGSVTFLFTDIEGSTRLLQKLGAESYAEALAAHRAIVREACVAHGGVEMDTQGDAFFIAFPGAPGALEAALDIVDRLEPGPIAVRIGLHTGTPVLTEEGYVGMDVHRAARIAAAGHGGQILISAATASLLHDAPLRNLGDHRLKDLSSAERLFQVGDAGFPPLKTLYQTNLPVPATPFVGREDELREVTALLTRGDVRMLTLVGPGGTGKTRLALQAAAAATEYFRDGLWWVPLAPLREADLLLPTIAAAVGVSIESDEPIAELLTQQLAGKKLLLVLDNAEHLLPAVRNELSSLRSVDGPTLLITSRERVQLQGESVWVVPPLGADDGVALFIARARSLDPGFTATSAVGELCTSLENLPLALELAAARTTLFTPAQLLDRLGERFELLKGGADVDPRQQTLRATIDWSYELLNEPERRLLAGLSVFAGGCTYEAAEAVGGADPDTLQSLIDKSLVRRRETEQEPRYWMLESIREYAAAKLDEDGAGSETRARQAHWCLELARRLRGRQGRTELQKLELELPNMRLARTVFRETHDIDSELELVGSLRTLWDLHGHRAEGLAAIEDALSRAQAADPRVEAMAWQALARIAFVTGLPRMRHASERSAELHRSLDDRVGLADSLVMLGLTAVAAEDLDAAEAAFNESASVSREASYAKGEAGATGNLGLVALIRGNFDQAIVLTEHALRVFSELGDDFGILVSFENLAIADLYLGRLDSASERAKASLTTARALGSSPGVAYALEVIGAIHADASRPVESARLLGAAEAIRKSIQEDSEALEARMHARAVARLDGQMEPEMVAREWARGAAMSLDEAIDFALDSINA